ncbi:MAG: hypothetical protein WBN92_00760 [Terriglobia bacterium]
MRPTGILCCLLVLYATADAAPLTPDPSSAAQTQDLPRGYAIRASMALTERLSGINGRLELLEDERLSSEIRRELWGSPIELACDNGGEPPRRTFCASVAHVPLRRAMVRLVGNDGRVIYQHLLERELGELTSRQLYGDGRNTYFITNDLSAGFGSYSGPVTLLAEVRHSAFHWLTATDEGTGHADTVSLMSSLKTRWEVLPPSAGSRDILQVKCRPDFEKAAPDSADMPFLVTFERYHYNGTTWVRRARAESGFWENDGAFPLLTKFPPP